MTIKRLEKEYKLILDDPPQNFVVYPLKVIQLIKLERYLHLAFHYNRPKRLSLP